MSTDCDPGKAPTGLLSTEPAGYREVRQAAICVLVSLVVFFAAVPFAKTPLVQAFAFIPMYVSALVICDLITAVLLFGQFSVLQTPALLVLASGYLFTASATVVYMLIFPGLFSPTGLFGAGPQTSSAMYMFWHSGFPLAVIGYTLLKGKKIKPRKLPLLILASPRTAIATAAVVVLSVVVGFGIFATWGQAWIPIFLNEHRTTTTGRMFLFGVWLLSLIALVGVWKKRPHTVLDIWLQVVMCVWLFDIALAALLNSGRYDLGWYVGRIYGLLAASFLLVVLLVEDLKQYKRLFQLSVKLSAANTVLANLARHDSLTGLANRRFFDEYLAEQIAIANRFNRPLALILCDIDHFKNFNDHYGHQEGDACLKRIARVLKSCSRRPADMVARYGGEEFAFILPDTDLRAAARVAEEVRAEVSRLGISHAYSSAGSCVSISSGVSELVSSMKATQLISAADNFLYKAKGQGRNQVVSTWASV
ncbi:diguanylate cyclase (GGDEF) domain-containing protein [Rhodoferax sp. OV413]|uniref:sensor domain-containing diguanylate cyclase n=1 Tax=Rhodoferax sp. OV413 TaxID=1855285 RepID=UPI000884E37E|nr:diguanylate cyclase [Rhodoferax sp. OV413]SDO89552.1 diguanylate cyclase (GGDEF) domain-containing protein [Rhodoferax sp. OV413]